MPLSFLFLISDVDFDSHADFPMTMIHMLRVSSNDDEEWGNIGGDK